MWPNDKAKEAEHVIGVRPQDARWWLAQWRQAQGYDVKVQEWLDGPFAAAVEAAAKDGREDTAVPFKGHWKLLQAIEDRLWGDGWGWMGRDFEGDSLLVDDAVDADLKILVTWKRMGVCKQ